MCAQYMMAAGRKDLIGRYSSVTRIDRPDLPIWDERVVPYRPGPVVVTDEDGAHLRLMQFSLVPSWSKEPRVKFASHNARLTSVDSKSNKIVPIYEKPTWKIPFRRHRCIVPMTHFIEPIYTGRFAGNMVQFFESKNKIFTAAGIWDTWLNRTTGEIIESFAVLTDEPDPFVKTIGHDRTPVFLSDSALASWLEPNEHDPKALVEILKDGRAKLSWDVKEDRPLKPGWQKRIPKD